QLVECQAAHEVVGDVGAAFEPEGVGPVPRDQEIEQDLALRRQQRRGFCFPGLKHVEIGGDDVLQEVLRVRAGDGDDRTVVEASCRHGKPCKWIGLYVSRSGQGDKSGETAWWRPTTSS